METIIYSHNMGTGIILTNPNELVVNKGIVTIVGEVQTPNVETTMSGYFKIPLVYKGYIKTNGLVFYIGNSTNLFETINYYQVVYRITDVRLFEMYTHSSGRDYNFINGIWK